MISDKEQLLIAGCKRGESWARRELYDKYAPAMLALCVRYVKDYEIAKDVLQEGFIKVFTRFHQQETPEALAGWIRRIFINASLESLRKNEMYSNNVPIENFSETATEFSHRQLEQVTAEDIMECISELPARKRVIFNLYAVEGYSHAEIAQQLGIKEASSRAQYARAREILQKIVFNLIKKENVI